jgi:hypothetical protein
MSPVGADFVRPGEDHVPSLIDDLVAFANRDDLPILIQVAVAHAQFETIHPFTDGNGRTGRALVQAMLRAKGLTKSVTVPVSAGLLTDVDGYHRALTSYRAGDIRPIVDLTANASLRAIGNARRLVTDTRDVRESWNGRLTARRDSAAWKILDIIARQPPRRSRLIRGTGRPPRAVNQCPLQQRWSGCLPLGHRGCLPLRSGRTWFRHHVSREHGELALQRGRPHGLPHPLQGLDIGYHRP